jgi:hypothetical protein
MLRKAELSFATFESSGRDQDPARRGRSILFSKRHGSLETIRRNWLTHYEDPFVRRRTIISLAARERFAVAKSGNKSCARLGDFPELSHSRYGDCSSPSRLVFGLRSLAPRVLPRETSPSEKATSRDRRRRLALDQ